MEKQYLFYTDLIALVNELVYKLPKKYKAVYGVPRGGVLPGYLVAQALNVPLLTSLKRLNNQQLDPVLIVDDIIDNGTTRQKYFEYDFAALYSKQEQAKNTYFARHTNDWIVFPWEYKDEEEEGIKDNIIRILEFIGEDPKREGLLDTPKRVEKAYKELFKGYTQNPSEVLHTRFTSNYDQMVVLKDIEFYSFCEHHMLPFFGKVSIAYLPKGKVVGISKLARLVEVYARRLQIQEQLTEQIAQTIMQELDAQGVGVYIKAKHFCMVTRGVNKQNSEMVTSKVLGALMDKAEARNEFLRLID